MSDGGLAMCGGHAAGVGTEPESGGSRAEEIRQRISAVRARIDELHQGDAAGTAPVSGLQRRSAMRLSRRLPPNGRLPPASAPSAGQPRPTSVRQSNMNKRQQPDPVTRRAVALDADVFLVLVRRFARRCWPRRAGRPRPRWSPPPSWFGAIDSDRTCIGRNHEDLLAEDFGGAR